MVFLIGLSVTLFAFTGTSQSEDLSGSDKLNDIGSPQNTVLASGGQASMEVVVGPDASRTTTDAANELADYLGKITGGSFSVTTGNGSSGIAVGTYSDFPGLDLDDLFDSRNPARGDEHLVHSHGSGVYLVGATDLASQHAVWTLLYELGYRQYFPTETWEIIPDKPDLSADISSFESPDFYNRNGPREAAYTHRQLWHEWQDRNRMTSSFGVATGHAYNSIIRRNQEEFDANPQYTAESSSKFRVSEEGLVDLVVQDAVNRIKDDPDRMSVSMEPSDGGGWCDSPEEQAMGSISDRVVYLANAVAEAINDLGMGDRYVGIYAYNLHSAPPDIEVHPNVVVSVATAYTHAGYSVDELVEGWGRQGAMIGIRDYYDTFVWGQGMPRSGVGGNIPRLADRLSGFHENGARFMNANSVDSWPVNGPGFYLSSRLLWDMSLTENVEEIIEEFLEKSFGEAMEPMRKFYELVGRGRSVPRTTNDVLAHMYEYLSEAREITDDPEVRARLDEIVLYTRYVELYSKVSDADSDGARQSAAESTFRHLYRMQSIMMSPVRHLYHHFRRSDVSVEIPREADPGRLRVGRELTDMEPWKSSKLFTDEEIAEFVSNGLEKYEKEELDFDIVTYSKDLVPADSYLDLPEVRTGSFGRGFRGEKSMFTWLRAGEPLELDVRGGTISHYQDRGNVRFHLMSPREATTEAVDFDDSVPPDGETYQIELTSEYDGLHELMWNDGRDRTYLEWDEGHPMTVRASLDSPFSFQRDFRLFFYVPEGTKVVGGYLNHHFNVTFRDNNGDKIEGWQNEEESGYFALPVKEGQDGSLWRISADRNRTLRLMTVPPYLARSEQELLLPKELFEEDDTPTSAGQEEQPDTYELGQNYPNPFNPVTQIRFAVPEQSHVTLEVYNVLGQRVTTLLNEEKSPGRYEVTFDGAGLSSGVYLYRLQTDTFIETKQMMLVK
ncbi:DUF4838 domain-containing protein [Natronogracilivirgula saccharolytica]|uniref:DUF4838 domain-containing protein n=1 Tax=Natronogracilivirga saccharolytica TaxID=2812953 RepID=A0A8J7S8C8_9BACT|nr:DUF4838 domain-containing protein [Natronogracilivirga saccharolytica]